MKEKHKKVRKILIDLLFLNILVSVAKLVYGVMYNISSMIADGAHSLSDGASNIVGIVGITISSKPADEKHPYGHQKVETLSTIIISFMLFMVSFKIFAGAYEKIKNPVEIEVAGTSFIVMVCTLIVNVFVATYERKKGEALKSSILISDSKHTFSDILTSSVVIIGLIGTKMGYKMIDPIFSIIIALVIVKSAIEILKSAIDVLVDAQVVDIVELGKIVMSFSEVKDCHKIRTRGKEDHIMVDLHILIDDNTPINMAHKLSHDIERKLKDENEDIYEVIVHLEPQSSYLKKHI